TALDTTQDKRRNLRNRALLKARTAIDDFKTRLSNGTRLRSKHYRKTWKPLQSGFYWRLEDRNDLVRFLRERSWNVVQCTGETDVSIAEDIQPKDVVVSRDSDFFIFANVCTIWQPVGRGVKTKIHCYHLSQILDDIRLSGAQLTALGVVTTNDCTKNIHTLGIATNYRLIKDEIEDGS
ncbi:hypothetical protein BGW38_008274, partial [Lunasporangiospora selenospora]